MSGVKRDVGAAADRKRIQNCSIISSIATIVRAAAHRVFAWQFRLDLRQIFFRSRMAWNLGQCEVANHESTPVCSCYRTMEADFSLQPGPIVRQWLRAECNG